ncbi:MAG: inositol monophosphatase [Elusimicrobia bacterium]|nr:inositol monophosphatase [Elusimicrobiota bacterium]
MRARRDFIFELCATAGAMLDGFFGRVGLRQASAKKNIAVNLVSIADCKTQERAILMIRKNYPGEAILAEEGSYAEARESFGRGMLWIMDPLDGTVNFLHGYPMFAFSVAYCVDGAPVLGATLDVTRRELFWAERGQGAFLRCFNGIWTASGRDQRLWVSKNSKLKDSLMITGFAYDRQKRAGYYLGFYEKFLRLVHDVRRSGSACLDLAWVAAGRAEGFWEWKLNPWDVAAGALLIQEAGGRMSRFDGSPYQALNSDETLGTNGLVHTESLRFFK